MPPVVPVCSQRWFSLLSVVVLLCCTVLCRGEWITGNARFAASPRRKPECAGVLHDGFWSPHDNDTWLGDDCVYYRWSEPEARRCLARRTVLFVGGAYTRNLFRCFAELIAGGEALRKYAGANVLACNNFALSQDDLRLVLSSSPKQEAAPTFELLFYWNPLVSWANKFCHAELCVRHDGVAPADAGCVCPSPAKLGAPVSYTGSRVRAPFLRQLFADGVRPDVIVSEFGVGDIDDAGFINTLSLAPTLLVGYNPTHPLHTHTGVESSSATLVDFSPLVRERRDLMRDGHPSGSLLHVVVHNVMSLASLAVCPFERKFLPVDNVRTE